ncbi:LysR family transcriptional regulator [Clostridium sp. AF20-7]|jgi:DNA-binding transcriptional LysR family regulator|uniref:LysR family transcriptional regulator n=2 Tax=Clostridiaceae TaxID=31979 RepID=UPI000E5233DF|nr:LysR family transcriptional regulator [Clostridium sp. AM27-28]RHR03784.1 LysR family transcriptional regulator [Clostridium sp. AF20-7]RHT97463.1 LysR family transcriptional regulator [Clostridium sp. AM27-28]
MDMESIRAFLDVIQTGSITGAAKQRYMSQPALGKRMMALEKELGTELFLRGKGQQQIRMTAAGEAFVDIAERMELLYEQALRLKDTQQRVYLTAASIRSAHGEVFLPLLAYLRKEHPEICLTVEDHHTVEILPLLEKKRIDLGITQLPVTSPELVSELLYEEEYRVIQLQGGTLCQGQGRPVMPSKLAQQKGIFQAFDSYFQAWFESHWPLHTVKIRVNTTSTAELYFESPDDWMIAPAAVAREMEARGFVSAPLEDNSAPMHRVYLTYHRYRQEEPALRLTIDELRCLFLRESR